MAVENIPTVDTDDLTGGVSVVVVTKSKLNSLADAIMAKAGTTDKMTISEMTAAVAELGGAGSLDTSDATAVAENILAGKTAYIASGKVTGVMPTYDGSVVLAPIDFTVDIYGSADDPDATTRLGSYAFSAESGATFAEMIDETDWDGATAVLKYTSDAHEMVYLSNGSGEYSLAIPASDVIQSKTYKADWTADIGG